MKESPAPPQAPREVTGLVLAGGRGRRMGGRDKGLLELDGKPMVARVIERFAPQVESLLISANRNVERYREFGLPVLPDPEPYRGAGPLAGILAGMQAAATAWLAVVPCDAPQLPLEMVRRLSAALQAGDLLALPSDGQREQPLFCLLSRSLEADLAAWLAADHHSVTGYLARPCLRRRMRLVDFSESPENFANINRPEDRAGFTTSAQAGRESGLCD